MVVVRSLVFLLTVLAFWGVSRVFPDFLDDEHARWMAGIFVLVWGLVLPIFNKLADLANTPGLNTRERERLVEKLPGIRARMWHVGGASAACALLLLFLTVDPNVTGAWWFPLAVGALVGTALSYLVLVPAWHKEIQAFIDNGRLNESKRKARDDELSALSKLSKSQ